MRQFLLSARRAKRRYLVGGGFQLTLRAARDYEVSFAEDRIELRRFDAGTRARTEIIVSAEDDAELRRTTLTNESSRPREIEITSYAEIVPVLRPRPHVLLRAKRFAFDLVILNDHPSSDAQSLQEVLQEALCGSSVSPWGDAVILRSGHYVANPRQTGTQTR